MQFFVAQTSRTHLFYVFFKVEKVSAFINDHNFSVNIPFVLIYKFCNKKKINSNHQVGSKGSLQFSYHNSKKFFFLQHGKSLAIYVNTLCTRTHERIQGGGEAVRGVPPPPRGG